MHQGQGRAGQSKSRSALAPESKLGGQGQGTTTGSGCVWYAAMRSIGVPLAGYRWSIGRWARVVVVLRRQKVNKRIKQDQLVGRYVPH